MKWRVCCSCSARKKFPDSYSVDSSQPDGRNRRCRACCAASVRASKARERERLLADRREEYSKKVRQQLEHAEAQLDALPDECGCDECQSCHAEGRKQKLTFGSDYDGFSTEWCPVHGERHIKRRHAA